MMDRNAIYDAWRTLSGASRLALGLAGAAIIMVLWISPAVISAIFVNSLDSVTQETGHGETEALAYRESVRQNIEFVSQRSPFFLPAPPPAKSVESVPIPVVRETPPPRTYGGPRLIGLVGSEGALFDKPIVGDKQYIAIGQKGGQVEIISIMQPWQARVRWAGGEFDLNLFDRLEALPAVGNFGEAAPLGQPTVNLFGGGATSPGTAATTSGDLNFGAAAGDSSDAENN